MTRAPKNRPTANAEFTDTVVWDEANHKLSSDADSNVDTEQTVEIAALLTDEETDLLLRFGKLKVAAK